MNVPCNGCTTCCYDDACYLMPDEDRSEYITEQYGDIFILAHKPNGACIYLGNDGCLIYERRPKVCRVYDCRDTAKSMTYTQVRKRKEFPIRVWKRGRQLLREANA